MNHNIITTSSMIQNRDTQYQQRLSAAPATRKHHFLGTLQVLLTAITMLFSVGVQGAWAERTFKDFVLDFTTGGNAADISGQLDGEGGNDKTLGITFDGSAPQYSATTTGANVVFTGKYHSVNYGVCGNVKFEVPVDGSVLITVGKSDASGDMTITNEAGVQLKVLALKGDRYTKDYPTRVETYEYVGEATTLTFTGGKYVTYFAVEKSDAVPPTDPTLTIDKTAVNVFTSSYMSSSSATVSLSGLNLTNGTYQVTQPSVDGLTISPTQFTVADGAVNQTFTISYNSVVEVASATADFTFATSDADKSETVTVTYGKTVKREKSPVSVSTETTWDFSGAATQDITLSGSTTPTSSEEFIYTTLGEVKESTAFDALTVKGQYAYYQGTSQVNELKFTTAVPGKVKVTFNAGTTSQTSVLYVNGTATDATSNNYDNVTKEVDVPAGTVVLAGMTGEPAKATQLRFSKVIFTPSAPAVEIPTFSLTEEQTVISTKTPDGWTAVQLPQIPEITESNATIVSGLVAEVDNTSVLQAALNAVPAEGGMVVVPAGTWLSGPLTMKSKTVLHLKAGATLKLLPFGTYPSETPGKFDATVEYKKKMFIGGGDATVNDIVIEGEGETSIIDGQGAAWWAQVTSSNKFEVRPPLIRFKKGARHLIRNFKMQNAPGTNLTIGDGGNLSHVTVHDIIIKNPSSIQAEVTADHDEAVSHNTDGIPVWGPNVNIYNCNISTGDDNIVFDSNSQYCHVWDCDFGRGHGASFGSYTERVHHIIYEGITFNGTSQGFRIKTNRSDRSGNDAVGTNGAVHDIICRNSTMTGVTEPIILTTHYNSEKQDPASVEEMTVGEKTPEYRNFLFQNITATNPGSAYSGWNHARPIYIYGLPEKYIHDITFDNVKITSAKGMYLAYCEGINFINGCKVTNTANAENFIDVNYNATVTGNYGQPIERTFQDFKINFRNQDGYQMITPAELPDGVTINGTFHDGQHGYNTTTITVPVDGPVKFTFGACGSGGNAIVKNQSNETIATIDCKSGGCDTTTSFDHLATWIYNSTTPQTLTITTAQYIPFFYAEKCEYIPPVTVTYYDADGTTPIGEPQEMEAGSGLVIKYGESDVNVPSGKKFRNWRVGSASGPKAVDGMSIAENTSLYALATDVEQVGTHYAPNLNNFNAEEHDVIVAVRNCSDGNGHGLNMGGSGEVEFKVAGPTKITLGRCRHANESAKYIIKKASVSAGAKSARLLATGTGDELFSTSAYSATDGETVDFDYDGEATNLIITCDAQAYLHSLELTPAAASEPATLEDVTGDITWDWGGVTTVKASGLYNPTDDGIKLTDTTSPKNTDEVIMSTYADNHITFANTFNAAAISFKGTYPSRKNMAQAGILHFHTTVPGKIKVTFSDTGSSASASAIKRYLNVNGENTEYWTSRPTSGTEKSNDKKESGEIAVPAGDVYIKAMKEDGTSSTDVCFYKVVFTADAPADPEPVADETIFSMDVATTVTEKVSFAAGETALTDTHAVLTGGTAVVRNGQSGAKDLINAQDEVLYFAMTNGNTNYKVTLTKALAAGDVITADIPNSSTERGLIFSSTKNSTPNPIPDGIVYVNGTSVNSLTYTLKETDTDLVGKTEFYILRSTGTGTYFKNFVITRPAPKAPRTFKDFKLDFRTNPYSVVEPAEGLPSGVSITGSFHDGQHGYNPGMKIVVPVDGAVEFTIGTSSYGAAYTVSGATGYSNNGGTDNRAGEFTKYTTYRYNSEEAATLTFDFSGYVPYFFAKACDYIPQVTVKYYDVDKTTLLETEIVDGSSALAYNASAVSKVTVESGKSYRGFWKNKADNKKVAEGFTLNADIELYPSVTDIETPTKTSEHTLNLVDAGFYIEEHDIISVSGGSLNAQHGWQLAKDQYMNVKVAGNATITVGLCLYAGSGDLVLQDDGGNEVSRIAAKVASDGATHTFIYEGAAGTLKLLASDNSTYIHSIKITHTGDLTLPVWSDEKEAYTFTTKSDAATNAKELLYAISYVNTQTEHAKKLWIPNGTYDLGTAHNTSIPAGMHLIGERQDGVLIKNQPTEESINQTATFQIDGAGVTLENMTIKCRAPYTPGDGHNAERGVCVQDCGDGTRYINVTLDGLQDTYYSNGAAGMKATFDNCIVRGNVDFFCGNGDITVNESRLQIVTTHGSGGTAIICAPATYTNGETQGYQFNNCIVEAATSEVGCLVSGHSTNLKFNLARAWYAGGSTTMGLDRTPRVTFTDTDFEIKQAADWGGSIGYAQAEERRVFNIVNTGVQFSDEAMVIDKTNKPFAYATANDRTDPASVNASNITGGGEYDLETIMEKMEADGGYTAGTSKEISTSNGTKKAIVLKSANTTENGKEKRVAMDQTIIDAINNNDIIVLDGAGYSDFVVKSVMTFRKVEDKTVVGINGARLCTEWYLTDYFKSILENVPTSSGTGVNSASTAEGTGGDLYDKDGKLIEHIKEEGEYLTRKNLYEAVGNEDYRYSGIFYLGACKNWIIRNLKLVGPGSLDCAGYDLMAIIDSDSGTKFSDHMWVDHCEFIDGMDGNFDITNGSDFVTVSWCKFYYTDRSYAHQNTNLVGSSDDKKAMDGGKLNITFAYNEWGENCRARMPMARYGRIHMLNNYYNCAGNSEYAMNPRIESEFLVEGNYWERGVRRAYNPNGQKAVTWGDNNYYADKAADKAGSSNGDFTVTVPYQYSSLMLDPHKVPEVITLNGGAKLYQKPYFTTNLGVADNTPDTDELQHNAELSKELKEDGLVFSVWAENAHTFQWYKQDIALDGTEGEWAMLEGENRNTYTFKPVTGVEFNLKCQAFGVSGETTSDVLKVKIDGLAAPYYLGGIPTEMQTVYTGSPITFTANFKDAQGYQWYKSATEDRAGATAIDGATSNTYTYDPSSAEIFYLYCVASNSNDKGDGYSDVVKVKGVKRDLKFHLYSVYDAAASQTSVFVTGTSDHNINNVGTKNAAIEIDHTGCTTTDKVGECSGSANSTKDSDNNSIPGFRFNNCNTAEHKNVKADVYLHFTLSNAIAEGDKILMSMITGGSGNPGGNYGFHICSASSLGENNANVLKTVGIPSNSTQTKYVYNPEAFAVPAALVGKTEFYVIPFVAQAGKNVQLNDMQIFSGETKPVDDPVITTDLNETYETGKNTTLNLSVEATDAASYQWYSNTVQNTEGATLIEGATSATYNYPTDKVGTKYVYCVVTGSKLGSAPVNSTIAKVSVVDGATATITYPTANIKADGTGVSDPDGIMSEISVKLEGDKYSWDTSFSNNKNDDNTTYACIKASAAVPENADFVTFTITPKNGKMLIADELSFGVCRVGTDNGDLKVYANGTLLTEASGKTVVKPGRNSDGKKQDGYVFSYSLKDYSITETEPLTIKLNLYGSISGKTWGIADLKVTGIVKDYVITNVSNPKSEKGTWDEENEKWNYTLSCASMDFAKLNYQIGEESVQSNQTNPVSIKVAPGATFKFWGSDPREGDDHLENSEVITEEADAMPATTTPVLSVEYYDVAKHNYPVSITGADAEAKVYYTLDGTEPTAESSLYNAETLKTIEPGTIIKAVAIRLHYANSPVLEALAPAINLGEAETFKTTGPGSADGEASGKNNVIVSGTIDGANISGIDGATGLKYTTSREVTVIGDTKVKGIQIDVHEGFVVTEVQVNNAYSNDKSKSTKITAVYVDGVKLNDFEAKELPASGSGSIKFAIEGLTAKNSIILETSYDTDNVNQARAAISLVYEFVDAPAGVTITDSNNSSDVITLAGDDLAAFKTNHTYTVDVNKVYAEDPIVKITTEKGYEYIVPAGDIETEGDKLTHFTKSFVGVDYTVKAKVNAVKSPNIEIANEMSLKGGYKVTLSYSKEDGIFPYINVDNTGWVAYDPEKEYFALGTVQSKMKYGSEQSLQTVARSADCPSNSYVAGKPFAVYLYVNGYQDNQTGAHIYNNQKFGSADDKIYSAIANQFNVIPLAVNNNDAILEKRPDINDAKLVVITESLGGSGSVEIEGVGNKSNMMALTLKRDVLDKTNVLNLKMFLNGSSSANNQRWQWAQPRAMASELTSIMPCTPDGGGMYEIFGNATMSRDASINLWDDINTENMLYHLQPVFNFNEDNESRPIFTPLALVIDPEEPEDEREQYHAIHFYENNGFQYVAFGLSINEWKQYNDNVYAIIDKIGEMIKADKSLDSKLEGIVEPKITDNGDGSANVMNNNLNADTYYVVYTKSEYDALKDAETGVVAVPTADDIINGNIAGHTTYKANDTDFHTEKYTEKMHIFAVSKLGTDAKSAVIEGTVEGNSIRYVIRENDDPAAQGLVAKYPFDLNVNSGTFNMPYNQSWKKDGYTVTEWEVVNETSGASTSSGTSITRGSIIKPGETISGLTQDITVKAIWTENKHKITDLGKNEDKTQRTVTWEFLQSKGAPALALENKAGNMQAILVGQAKFSDDTFIDVPMTINTDNIATLPDNGTEYHGKFNNTSTNWAKALTDGDKEYTGSDYAQVRTGTQFTFPMVYGSNVVYKGVELVEAVNGVANGNVNRSQISQSYITDGSKTADALNYWRLSNPGFELDPGWTGEEGNKVLQPNSKVVMTGDKATLATTSPTYDKYKESMGAMGYDNILYDEDNEHHAIGGNFNYGGLIYYNGEATEATLTSVESAQYVNVGATTGKTLGGLNYGSVFMQSLSVTYPKLYDLTCTWVPAKSDLDQEENPGKIEKLNDPRPNCGGRYVLNDDIVLKLTPAYGYYVDVDDKPEEADNPYFFLKDGMDAESPLALVGATSKIYRYKDAGYAGYSEEIKANIPEDGAYITMKVQDIDLVVSMKKWPTVKYKVEAYPSTQGYITFNTGNGRPHEDEYKEFPVGKKFYITAHPNTGYKFKEWRRNNGETGEILVSQAEYDALVGDKTGYMVLPNGVTKGDGVMQNPFDPTDFLERDEMMFTVSEANNDFTYVAVFEEGKTGTAHYEFDHALLQTSKNQDHKEMTKLEITAEDKNKFPTEASSKALNIPYYYTLFKPGYTLDHWVEIEEEHETNEQAHTPADHVYGKSYRIGTFYYYATEGEVKHLVPVFTKNTTSYDYRATPVDITWDLRVAENAQRMTFKPGVDGTTATTKIYYSTHANINNGVLIDVPLTITLGKKGKLINDIEEEDKWCAMGEGTTIQIPSGLGAKFTIASLSKMETTTIDGVVPTSYTEETIDDAKVYLYTFTTQSEATSVTLKIGDDYTYYKYIRAELPAADAVPLTVTVNNDAFGTVDIAAARTTADVADNETLLNKINATKTPIQSRALNSGHQYTLGLGTIVSLHAKRSHLYVLDYFEDGDGHRYYYNKDDETKHLTVKDMDGNDITTAAKAVDEYLKMEKVQDFNTVTSLNDLQLTFQVQSYSESMHAVYKENTLYQVNYTSGEEAEGEAPGMTLVEDGESFTIPAENHHLYLDGQTLRYWMDEDGNKYDLGQSYTLGQTFTASKNLPSGIAKDDEFTVPKKDIFLTPVFKVNDFTVMNLSTTATATWPLSRKGGATYEGNGDIVINFEGINGIYVTPLKLSNGDFIDLKMDIRGENGKANNVNSTDRCQINSGTVFGLPSSSNCKVTLNSANSSITAKIDGTAVEGQQTVSSTYTGDKTQIDVNFTGNTYLYEVKVEYNPVKTDLPELDYATVGNISLGALGTPLANVKLSTLKNDGEVTDVPADLSNSTTGIMPVVRGTATRGGYVDVIQATIDNPVATMLVKTRDGVTVSVYKIGFKVTYPNIAPRVTDLKIDRKYQCDLKAMYAAAISDTRVDGTNYINDVAYLKHLGVDGTNAENERVSINGVINIKFSTKMAETTLPAATFQAQNGKATLGQAVYALEGQTLTFTYKGLDVDTEYDFVIPAGTFKDVFWDDATVKTNHVYNEPIRIHFTTVKTAISTERRVINYVVTHNQASYFDVATAKMVADGAPVKVASDELIANLEAAGIPYGTLDDGVKLANDYNESGKRFYIFVPDGEYQLMGNEAIKSLSSAPIGEDGRSLTLGSMANIYNGITTISHDNISITGQSQEKTIVYNHPAFEGLSYASTLKLNGGIANFYAQDLTLQNRFDFLRCRKVSSKGVAPALWDRSAKPIFKNVKFDSYQDTYYTNANNQFDDTRGYAEDCSIMGYVDFVCGDGDHWFQNCNMVVRQGVGSSATNMFAARQYDTQKWGYVMNKCIFSAENNTAFDVNNGKMTIARPWANSPAETLIECKYDVLSTDDGYKKMTGGGLIMRMQEYKSYDSNGSILDLSKRSLRNSTPGIGSYDAVMTPSKAAEYNLFDVMGGEDGYDPTLYTAQVNMDDKEIKQDDTSLTWDDKSEALCYFLFVSDTENGDYKLFTITDETTFDVDGQNGKWFIVRAANQRGGLGEPTKPKLYEAVNSYKRQLTNNNQVVNDMDGIGWRWSTIYLDFNAKAPTDTWFNRVTGKEEPAIYVYAVTQVNASNLLLKRVKVMEKNCGYIIKAIPRDEDYVFKYTETPAVYFDGESEITLSTYVDKKNQYLANKGETADFNLSRHSLLDGTVKTDGASPEGISSAGVNAFTLSNKIGLGFYKYTGNRLNQYYAWLDASLVAAAQDKEAQGGSSSSSSSSDSKCMRFIIEEDFDNLTTEIQGVMEESESLDDHIYNLNGQRINASQMQRGQIYIINGKKIRK